MRRNGVVGPVGEKHVRVDLGDGQYVRLKKTALPSLREDMRVVITMTFTKARKQPRVSAEETEERRRTRWAISEFMRLRKKGERPSLLGLMERSHLQLVEDDED